MDDLCQESVDDETAELLIRLQLDDILAISTLSKGKGREGAVSDQDLALQMYEQELESLGTFFKDRAMTKSIAKAVMTDGACLTETLSEERQAAADHNIAYQMFHGRSAPEAGSATSKSEDLDDEFLGKLGALYVSGAFAEATKRQEEEPQAAESSSWAASRKRSKHSPSTERKCASCFDRMPVSDLARLPCGHGYCRDCLETLFRMSMTDETLFPPRCCRKPIPVDRIQSFLAPGFLVEFENKRIELETPDRTYCSNRACSVFVPNTNIQGLRAICQECGVATCSNCKEPYHTGDCPTDEALQQVIQTARDNGWQRCRQCRRMIELEYGCHHMTCHCGAEFCYLCGEPWKNCVCEVFSADRLLARANVIQNRHPEQRQPVAEVMRNLLENHECTHPHWQYVRGPNHCEECYHNLPQYIFRCQRCQLQVCNRCRRNRLI